MSHSTISATRDYLPGHDAGTLTNPAQSASFTVDPLLTPITTSALPKPIQPDVSSIDNPELFDKSTGHMNTHYHPEAKLSKKKRAKKLGLGTVNKPHGAASSHAGGRTFSEHEKAAHERADKRDETIGAESAEDEEDDEDDDEDDDGETAQAVQQSDKQHHENRVTGTEKGEKQPTTKRNENAGKEKDDEEGDKEAGDDKEKGDNPSLIERATNVLSSAQQKATGAVSGVASTVLNTAQSVPGVSTLLSKVGLGSNKSDESADDKEGGNKEDDKEKDAEGDDKGDKSKGKEGGKEGGEEGPGSKKDVNAAPSTEAHPKKGDETFGKEQSRSQDKTEGALDKSMSQAGQKSVGK